MRWLFAVGSVLLDIFAWVIIVVATAWGAAAVWFDGPTSRWAAGALTVTYAALCLALPFLVGPLWCATLLVLVPVGVVLGWWFSISPSNERDWMPDVARLPTAKIEGSTLTVQNVRNFGYPPESRPVEQWETRTFDLDTLTGLDVFLCFWGPTLYCHTIMSWQFAADPPLAISIETRRAKGARYSPVKGFFRQFELYYVVADERDVIGLRASRRGEQVYLYRLKTDPGVPRELLLKYVAELDLLVEKPKWYNALTQNCTTTIHYHIKAVTPERRWDWRLLLNGHLDSLGYELGTINTSLPFAELKERSNITERAKMADGSPDFSERIREGLPERPSERAGEAKEAEKESKE